MGATSRAKVTGSSADANPVVTEVVTESAARSTTTANARFGTYPLPHGRRKRSEEFQSDLQVDPLAFGGAAAQSAWPNPAPVHEADGHGYVFLINNT